MAHFAPSHTHPKPFPPPPRTFTRHSPRSDLREDSGVRKAFYAIGMLLSITGVCILVQKANTAHTPGTKLAATGEDSTSEAAPLMSGTLDDMNGSPIVGGAAPMFAGSGGLDGTI